VKHSNSSHNHGNRRRFNIGSSCTSVTIVLVAISLLMINDARYIQFDCISIPIAYAFSTSVTTDSTKINGNNDEKRFLKIAFVTGNEMKVGVTKDDYLTTHQFSDDKPNFSTTTHVLSL
jgi:hypothetical protein